jgi:hypothetical protein
MADIAENQKAEVERIFLEPGCLLVCVICIVSELLAGPGEELSLMA